MNSMAVLVIASHKIRNSEKNMQKSLPRKANYVKIFSE